MSGLLLRMSMGWSPDHSPNCQPGPDPRLDMDRVQTGVREKVRVVFWVHIQERVQVEVTVKVNVKVKVSISVKLRTRYRGQGSRYPG